MYVCYVCIISQKLHNSELQHLQLGYYNCFLPPTCIQLLTYYRAHAPPIHCYIQLIHNWFSKQVNLAVVSSYVICILAFSCYITFKLKESFLKNLYNRSQNIYISRRTLSTEMNDVATSAAPHQNSTVTLLPMHAEG